MSQDSEKNNTPYTVNKFEYGMSENASKYVVSKAGVGYTLNKNPTYSGQKHEYTTHIDDVDSQSHLL